MAKETAWKQNKDGTWSRTTSDGTEETTGVNPNATQGALDAANEHGVDLNTLTGTGKDGAITKADVEAASTS